MREGWLKEKLGRYVSYEKGKKPKKQKIEPDAVFVYPYIDIEAFEKGVFNSYTDGEICNFCSENDFLMVWDGSRSGLVGKGVSGALGSTLMRINFPGIDNNYAFYFLKSKYVEINSRTKGTGTPHVDPNLLWNYNFPIAPLPEQRAIVAKIEQLFCELDNGIANLKTAKVKLEIYRQAVLKKAFEGELTGIGEKIVMNDTTLGELIEKPKYGTSKKCTPEPNGTPVLRIPNIGDGFVVCNDLKYAKFNEDESEALSLKNGDLLTIRSNGSVALVGKCALIKDNDTHCLYAGYLIRLRPLSEIVKSKYLLYCLGSHELRVQIESKAKSTSGVNNINSKELSNLVLPMCRLDEQQSIVEAIEIRLSLCDNILANIDEGLIKAEALRQSILKQAFEGQLLSEAELEVCRRAPDWEPANKLLERIKKSKKEDA